MKQLKAKAKLLESNSRQLEERLQESTAALERAARQSTDQQNSVKQLQAEVDEARVSLTAEKEKSHELEKQLLEAQSLAVYCGKQYELKKTQCDQLCSQVCGLQERVNRKVVLQQKRRVSESNASPEEVKLKLEADKIRIAKAAARLEEKEKLLADGAHKKAHKKRRLIVGVADE